jgi:hypothetical protein
LILFGENKSTVVYVAKKKTVRKRTVSYNTFKFADGIANKFDDEIFSSIIPLENTDLTYY